MVTAALVGCASGGEEGRRAEGVTWAQSKEEEWREGVEE